MSGDGAAMNILVVEDEMIIALHLEEMLQELGHVVRTASRVQEGLGLLEAGPTDFAILDVNLGGEPSFPIADRLLARGIPFAFATGYGGRLLPEPHAGTPVLEKPFGRAELARVLAAGQRRG